MSMKKEVFISYHTSSSKHVVENVCAALEGAGISCWYAPRDVEGPYASSIVKAVKECKVFLLILNEEANASEHVLNEINCAFERFRAHEDIVLLPFRIDECELSDAVWYYLGRIHIMDGGIPPAMIHIKELIDRISTILGKEQVKEVTVKNEDSEVGKKYRIVGRRDYPDNCFVGRNQEIESIRKQMESRQNKLLLVGMGGIGKSEIAKMYCDRYRDKYDVVLWISFDGSLQDTVINDFTFPIHGLSRSDYPDDSDREYFLRKIDILKEIADERVLIVVDNFDVTKDESLDIFCEDEYSVLFTTRYHSISRHLPELEIREVTDMEEMFELFRTEYLRDLSHEDTETVQKILNLIGGHPLSIRLVASAMQSRRISPEKMWDLLQEGAAEMEKQNMKAADIIFGRLKQVFSLSVLTQEEQQVLKNLSLLPLRGISVEQFYDWCELDDFDVIDELIQKSWVIHNSASDEVHLHPLVSELMREQLQKDLHACDRLVDFLVRELPLLENKKYTYKKQFVECFSSVSKNLPMEHPGRWDIVYGAGHMMYTESRFEAGIEILKKLQEQTTDLEHQLKLSNKIAKGYCDCGFPEEVIDEAEKGLHLVEGLPEESFTGKTGAHKRNLHIRLADAYRILGQYAVAEKYMRMTLENFDIYYDNSPEEERAWTEMFLGRILTHKTDAASWEEADQLFVHSLDHFAHLNQPRGQGFTYLHWCQLRIPQKQYTQGLTDVRKAYELLTPYLGEMNLNIALLKLNEANLYRAMGDEASALPCYAKAREMVTELGHLKMAEKISHIAAGGEIGYVN